VGAFTDVAPLGQTGPKRAHELTAAEDCSLRTGTRSPRRRKFKALLKAKFKIYRAGHGFFHRLIISRCRCWGLQREWMEKQVFGVVNLAYLFALSQFVMAWTVAALYVRAAGRFDKMAGSDPLETQARREIKCRRRC